MEFQDFELVQKASKGDQDAFAELLKRYKKLVYSVVHNMISDKQEISDITQDVFVKIYKNLDRYNPEFKFSTWAVKITTNHCLDILRKKKLDTVDIEEVYNVSDGSDSPETTLIKKEKSRIIRNMLEELPIKYKTPLILFHQHGLSYEEMTKVLNEPLSIIKNRLYRARLMLREKMEPKRKEGIL